MSIDSLSSEDIKIIDPPDSTSEKGSHHEDTTKPEGSESEKESTDLSEPDDADDPPLDKSRKRSRAASGAESGHLNSTKVTITRSKEPVAMLYTAVRLDGPTSDLDPTKIRIPTQVLRLTHQTHGEGDLAYTEHLARTSEVIHMIAQYGFPHGAGECLSSGSGVIINSCVTC